MGTIVLFASFFLLLFVGAPIALALGGSAFLYVVLFTNISPIIAVQQIISILLWWNSTKPMLLLLRSW